jgi:hypothetical protein
MTAQQAEAAANRGLLHAAGVGEELGLMVVGELCDLVGVHFDPPRSTCLYDKNGTTDCGQIRSATPK